VVCNLLCAPFSPKNTTEKESCREKPGRRNYPNSELKVKKLKIESKYYKSVTYFVLIKIFKKQNSRLASSQREKIKKNI